jgi:hypothetical protein
MLMTHVFVGNTAHVFIFLLWHDTLAQRLWARYNEPRKLPTELGNLHDLYEAADFILFITEHNPKTRRGNLQGFDRKTTHQLVKLWQILDSVDGAWGSEELLTWRATLSHSAYSLYD